jgi:hypothetical protein
MYASSWFLTLFTTALPLPVACRIMDVFLAEGMEVIFKVALALLTLGKEDLLCLDMEGMLKVSFSFIRSFTCQEVHYKFQNSGHRQKSNAACKMQQTYEYILKLNAV